MKLEIQSVTFKNFLSFGAREQTVPFHPGVNVVLGVDKATERSNGSGKSSFLETIPFALYGQTHKDIRKEQLINWKNRKACEVSLKFKRGETQYEVLRAIKPDNLEIYENNKLIEKPANVRDYQKILEDIIGLSFRSFCSLIHSNVNSSNQILSMGKPEKRKFIEEVFGLSVYSEIHSRANERIRSLNEKLQEIKLRTNHNEISIQEAKNRIEEMNGKISRIGSHDVELKDAEIGLQELLEENKGIEENQERISNEISLKEDESNKASKLINKVDSKRSLVNSWIKDADSKLLELEESKKIREEYLKFVKKHGKPSEINEKIDDLKVNIQKLTSEVMLLDGKIKTAEIEHAKLETNLGNEKKKLELFEEYAECPTCGQSLSKSNISAKEIINSLNLLIEAIRADMFIVDTSILSLKSDHKHHSVVKEALESELSGKEEQRDYLYSLKDKIKSEYSEDQIKHKKHKYTNTISHIDILTSKLEERERTIKGNISGLRQEFDDIQKILKQINQKRSEIDVIKQKIELEQKTKDEFVAIIETEAKNIEKLKSDNKDFQKKEKTFINILDYLNLIKEICKDENIKQYAISSIMPFLNQQTNRYLSDVGYSFYTVLDKWLDAEILGPGITKATYGSLSGGEGRGIDLALQFSLLDIARIQAGVWPDILIMDEILDSSVDSRGIDKIMQIIRTKQSDENNKIFIISHRDEIGAEFNADNIYFVTKDQYSTVEVK